MLDRSAESDETPALQLVCLAQRDVTYAPLQHLHGSSTVNVMFLHPGGIFHGDQNDPEVPFFVKGPRMDAGWPRLPLLRISDFARQVKVREIPSHVAVIA